MNYAIIGTGGIGGYYGSRLAQSGRYDDARDMPKCDVVLVCLKTVNNHLLESLLPPVVRDDTLVVLIQNGIGVEQDVQEMFPGLQLVAGLAFICSAKAGPGRIDHQCVDEARRRQSSADGDRVSVHASAPNRPRSRFCHAAPGNA